MKKKGGGGGGGIYVQLHFHDQIAKLLNFSSFNIIR